MARKMGRRFLKDPMSMLEAFLTSEKGSDPKKRPILVEKARNKDIIDLGGGTKVFPNS
jgi:hypothetical protein